MRAKRVRPKTHVVGPQCIFATLNLAREVVHSLLEIVLQLVQRKIIVFSLQALERPLVFSMTQTCFLRLDSVTMTCHM